MVNYRFDKATYVPSAYAYAYKAWQFLSCCVGTLRTDSFLKYNLRIRIKDRTGPGNGIASTGSQRVSLKILGYKEIIARVYFYPESY
jgi:hypothetical protein